MFGQKVLQSCVLIQIKNANMFCLVLLTMLFLNCVKSLPVLSEMRLNFFFTVLFFIAVQAAGKFE